MPSRTAEAEWRGDLKHGQGKITYGGRRTEEIYTAESRFGKGAGANPEELIGAAHAACFSMALAGVLTQAGYTPETIATEAKVVLEEEYEDYAITTVELRVEAKVPKIDEEAFQEFAEEAKENCPVSKALAGCEIVLEARLLS